MTSRVPPLTALLGASQGAPSVGSYLDRLRVVHQGLLDLVEAAAALSRSRPHLREHAKYLQEVATKLIILESEATDRMD